jgi:hypothetical protein
MVEQQNQEIVALKKQLEDMKANCTTDQTKQKRSYNNKIRILKRSHNENLAKNEKKSKRLMDATVEKINTEGCASAPLIKATICKYHAEIVNISKRKEYETTVFPKCKERCNSNLNHDAPDDEQHMFFWCTWDCVTQHVMLGETGFQEYAVGEAQTALQIAQTRVMQSLGNEAIFTTQTNHNHSVFHNNNNVFVMSSTPCLAGNKGKRCRRAWKDQLKAVKQHCTCASSNVKDS